MRSYELLPDDHHKSFYGRAVVTEDDEGNKTLYSYGTPIVIQTADGELKRIWTGSYIMRRGPFMTEYEEFFEWTATTGRHVRAFCGLHKKEFLALPLYEGEEK